MWVAWRVDSGSLEQISCYKLDPASAFALTLFTSRAMRPVTPRLATPIPIGRRGDPPGACGGPVTKRVGEGVLVDDGGVLDDDGGVVGLGEVTVVLAMVSACGTVQELLMVFSTVNCTPVVGTEKAKVPGVVAVVVAVDGDAGNEMETGAGVAGMGRLPAKVSSIVDGDPLVVVTGITKERGSVLSLNCTPSSTKFFGTVTSRVSPFSETVEPLLAALGVAVPTSVAVKGTVPATGMSGQVSVKLGVLAYAWAPKPRIVAAAVAPAVNAATPVSPRIVFVSFMIVLLSHNLTAASSRTTLAF